MTLSTHTKFTLQVYTVCSLQLINDNSTLGVITDLISTLTLHLIYVFRQTTIMSLWFAVLF